MLRRRTYGIREISSQSGQYMLDTIYKYGVYKSSDFGVTWVRLTILSGASYVNVYMSESGQYQYISQNAAIYRSDDYGETWNRSDNPYGAAHFGGMSGDGKYIFYIMPSTPLILISDDYGVTFNRLTFSSSAIDVQMRNMSYNGKNIVLTSGDKVYISNDYGVTWSATQPIVDGVNFNSCNISDDGIVIVGKDSAYIYRSDDYGVTWTSPLKLAYRWPVIAASKDFKYLLASAWNYSNYSSYIYRSDDYGVTWSLVTSTMNYLYGCAISRVDSSKMIFSEFHGNKIRISNDHGITWSELANSNSGWHFNIDLN